MSSYFVWSFELYVLWQLGAMSQRTNHWNAHCCCLQIWYEFYAENVAHDEIVEIAAYVVRVHWLILFVFRFLFCRSMWDALLKSVRCEIISFKRNDEIDAYVLRWVMECQMLGDKEMCVIATELSNFLFFALIDGWIDGFWSGEDANALMRNLFLALVIRSTRSVSPYILCSNSGNLSKKQKTNHSNPNAIWKYFKINMEMLSWFAIKFKIETAPCVCCLHERTIWNSLSARIFKW